MVEFPRVVRVRQTPATTALQDVERSVAHQLAQLRLGQRIRPGHSVAITAGSRGIANVARITRAVASFVQSLGALPFVVAAMGSHGGATVSGQRKVLAEFGITPELFGCPVRCGTTTEVILDPPDGFPIHIDRRALSAGHLILCNRIKPHTSIAGRFESGLMKMLFVGLGNHPGAQAFHRALTRQTFDQIVDRWGAAVLSRCNVVCGLAIVENASGQTARIEAIAADRLLSREPELLDLARDQLARLPFAEIDLLVVDEIGKNISGTGMDTNVVGRKFDDHQARPGERPRVQRIAVRSLTPQSQGNATGIGLAEYCHRQVLQRMDRRITRINCQAAGHPGAAVIPPVFDTDRQMIAAALVDLSLPEAGQARLVWIRNTLQLGQWFCSTSLQEELAGNDTVQIVGPPQPLPLDAAGNLLPWN